MILVNRQTAREQIASHLTALRRDEVPFYFIDKAGHTPLGLWGYLNAAQELHAQFERLPRFPDRIYLPCGTGTTQAGLLLGLRLLGCPVRVTGVSVARTIERCQAEIEQVIEDFCRQHDLDNPLTPGDIEIDNRWVGPAYDAVPRERWRFIIEQAGQRGLLLDPIYTSRAMQATLDSLSRKQDTTVVFLHTGGLPGLFDSSLHDELGPILRSNPIARSGENEPQ
jgi:1-aminocyclopropane-1-carboxylate deaminase/D-cysteine desulfhydrase-like pyridoxal-dependent ACC family enzyme